MGRGISNSPVTVKNNGLQMNVREQQSALHKTHKRNIAPLLEFRMKRTTAFFTSVSLLFFLGGVFVSCNQMRSVCLTIVRFLQLTT